MSCPALILVPVLDALQRLSAWIESQLPELQYKLEQPLEKVSDAYLIAISLLKVIHGYKFFSHWWGFLKTNFLRDLPSDVQASTRLARLAPLIEKLALCPRDLKMIIVDSMPLPTCRYSRRWTCKTQGATLGFSTQGKFFGFKLHVWISLEGEIVNYCIQTAEMHDVMASYELNRTATLYGLPDQLGDKAYVNGINITPKKKNAKKEHPKWKPEYKRLRQQIERVFSRLEALGIRLGQVKSQKSLRTRVALSVLAYNLQFIKP